MESLIVRWVNKRTAARSAQPDTSTPAPAAHDHAAIAGEVVGESKWPGPVCRARCARARRARSRCDRPDHPAIGRGREAARARGGGRMDLARATTPSSSAATSGVEGPAAARSRAGARSRCDRPDHAAIGRGREAARARGGAARARGGAVSAPSRARMDLRPRDRLCTRPYRAADRRIAA